MTVQPTQPTKPFALLDEAQRFVEQRAYDHFRATAEWPRARDFDLDYYELLDPLGGLQLVCKRIGYERISCGSPVSESDRIELRWPALAEVKGGQEDITNFLAAVRLAAERYHSARGKNVQLQVAEVAEALKIDELAAKRVIELMLSGNSISGGGGGGTVTLAYQVSRMRGVRTLEDYLARVAADVERRQLLAEYDRGGHRPVPHPPRRIFLSHAAADAALAHHVANVLRQGAKDLRVFVASKAGDIPTGADWLATIETELEEADTYVLLLTPRSVDRLWFWYESGAAWMSDRPFIPVTASGLLKSGVPYPLGAKQALSLEEPGEVEQLARDLGVAIPDPGSFCATLRELSKALPPDVTTQFVGVALGDRFFDWDGPLHELEERQPIPTPQGLIEALKAGRTEPSFGHIADRRRLLAKGWLQVLETDRRKWKREILYEQDGNQVLFVIPPVSTP